MRLILLTLLTAIFGGTVPVSFGAESIGTVRFLCLTPDLPPKYRRSSTGAFIAEPYSAAECPPTSIYAKMGKDYTSCSFVGNGLSSPNPLRRGAPGKGAAVEGYFFKLPPTISSEGMDAEGQFKVPVAPAASKAHDEWVGLIKAPSDLEKHYLACLYQPTVSAKWHPPKSLLIDIGNEALPAGASLIINLSAFPITAQVGSGSKLVSVNPGACAYSVAVPGATALSIKLALMSEGKMRVAYNREIENQKDSRVVVVAYAANTPEGKGRVNVRHFMLREEKPAVEAPAQVLSKK